MSTLEEVFHPDRHSLPQFPRRAKWTLLTEESCKELQGQAFINQMYGFAVRALQFGRANCIPQSILANSEDTEYPTIGDFLEVMIVTPDIETLVLEEWKFSLIDVPDIQRLQIAGAFESLRRLDIGTNGSLYIATLFDILQLAPLLRVLSLGNIFGDDGAAADIFGHGPLRCQLRTLAFQPEFSNFHSFRRLLRSSALSLRTLGIMWTHWGDYDVSAHDLLVALDSTGPSIHTLWTVGNRWTDAEVIRRCPSLRVLVIEDSNRLDGILHSLNALTQPLRELRIVGHLEDSSIYSQARWLLHILPTLPSLRGLRILRLHASRHHSRQEDIGVNHPIHDLKKLCAERGLELDSAWTPEYRRDAEFIEEQLEASEY